VRAVVLGQHYRRGENVMSIRTMAEGERVDGTVPTTPVGKYSPAGDSPYGVADMAGNVGEWTSSLDKSYPYRVDDGREDQQSRDTRESRGGSFIFPRLYARCAYRSKVSPNMIGGYDGSRVVVSPT
jgi:toxoflavin biosynthesis protein ToxD